ncbi:MAG: class I SAM-dependent DNA methyltransferase, partial [Synergistaceae bacterium]|nr:class I SAM-dependent DNA methyltransferase [Synergistaceae bacterium]
IYDMERPKAPPAVLSLSDLKRDWHKLSFIVDVKAMSPNKVHEVELSVNAGELVGRLYDSLLERYINKHDKDSLMSLNIFCVRVVFLLYAEDSGLFAKSQFHNYLKPRELVARTALRDLFKVLNQKENERDPYLEADLKAFPYVNGGLFAYDDIELPQLDGEPLRIIIQDMSEGFDWSGISPTIFGAVFESTLNPETRHSGGMHYTSVENIHKVIDPLFLDELNEEFETIIKATASRSRTQKLRAFQKKLGTLKFFDPACGSGNFLTESYLSLRRLENRVINNLAQSSYSPPKNESLIKVSISQFYGIEINDFAVSVARTALWIAESQMWNETQSMDKAQTLLPFLGDLLPLTSYNHIIEANALRMNWRTLVPSSENLYIMGNPPFLGYSIQSKEQKQDILSVFVDEDGKPYKTAGKIDYVAGWYFKAAEFIQNTNIKAAFVSTNSITQGEQVSAVFKTLSERFNIHVDFAHTTFIWDSEATDKAHVHVVVIGFNSMNDSEKLKRLYTPEGLKLFENINFYLVPAPNVFAEPIKKAVSKEAPTMMGGNRAADGGNLIIEACDYEEFIRRDPKSKKYIKRYMMGNEFINNITRYCLWLIGVSPGELRSMPLVMERVRA